MILKEAYRYQNFLERLLYDAMNFMYSRDFLTTTTQLHLRTKTNPDGINEEITVPKKNEVSFTPNQIVDFVVKVLSEKEKLSNAIYVAKKNAEIDVDAAVSMNKRYQAFVEKLKYMDSIKYSEKDTIFTDYKMNAIDGNQLQYKYPGKEIITIDFNRNDVRALIKKYSKLSDEVSTKLDTINITTNVDYEPIWDLPDTLENIVSTM